MNQREMQVWLMEHLKTFPSVASWMESNDSELLTANWSKVLADVRADDAKEFTRLIAAGDLEKPMAEDTAIACRRFCKVRQLIRDFQHQEKQRSGRVVPCGLCHGTGYVTIWHPLLVRAIVEECEHFRHPSGSEFVARWPDGRFKDLSMAAICKCAAGDLPSQAKSRKDDSQPRCARLGVSFNFIPKLSRSREVSIEDAIRLDVEAADQAAKSNLQEEVIRG